MTTGDERLLRAVLVEFGRELALAGTAVSETQERLARIAAANGERASSPSACSRRRRARSARSMATRGRPSRINWASMSVVSSTPPAKAATSP